MQFDLYSGRKMVVVVVVVVSTQEFISMQHIAYISLQRELTCHMQSQTVTCHLADVTLQPMRDARLSWATVASTQHIIFWLQWLSQ